MSMAVTDGLDPKDRSAVWESTILTGGLCEIKNLRDRLEYELVPFLASSETSHEFQSKEIKYVRIPEFYAGYKDNHRDANYLGAVVLSKLLFMDSRNYVSRNDYMKHGPFAINMK